MATKTKKSGGFKLDEVKIRAKGKSRQRQETEQTTQHNYKQARSINIPWTWH